jgi:ATP-binding cassette subfamily C protein LapB
LVDRIIVLQDGKIVMDGSKQQILQQSVSNQAEATA